VRERVIKYPPNREEHASRYSDFANMKLNFCIMLIMHQLLASDAFVSPSSVHGSSFSATTLFGLKRQRQGLADLAEGGITPSPKKKVKKSRVTQTMKDNSKKVENVPVSTDISPALAQWAAAGGGGGGESSQTSAERNISVMDSATEFVPFPEEGKGRRTKQSEKVVLEKLKSAAVQQILNDLEDALAQKGGGVDRILEQIQKLMNQPSTNLRVITAGKEQIPYRLAWVGSDEAICHVGTGLHKVPLARLQEIFLTCQGRNRIELFEVISILGPFPNVRNTLQGASEVTLGDVTDWTIAMDSMIDGTGKEILAGKEDNIRRVKLQIYFSDANAIVAVVPPENGKPRENPLENSGYNVLLFVREDAIDEKLEALRVL
jgi:hypothetical protein